MVTFFQYTWKYFIDWIDQMRLGRPAIRQIPVRSGFSERRKAPQYVATLRNRFATIAISAHLGFMIKLKVLNRALLVSKMSLINISEPTREAEIVYVVFRVKKKMTMTSAITVSERTSRLTASQQRLGSTSHDTHT